MIKKLDFGPIPEPTADDARLPYQAPRLEWEGLFEVLALACGKTNPQSFNCARVPRMS
jgi:hypothetical protein